MAAQGSCRARSQHCGRGAWGAPIGASSSSQMVWLLQAKRASNSATSLTLGSWLGSWPSLPSAARGVPPRMYSLSARDRGQQNPARRPCNMQVLLEFARPALVPMTQQVLAWGLPELLAFAKYKVVALAKFATVGRLEWAKLQGRLQKQG